MPKEVEVPYSRYQVVASPFGFTVPLSVAFEVPTAVAGAVVTTGGAAAVKMPSSPFVVADEFLATRR